MKNKLEWNVLLAGKLTGSVERIVAREAREALSLSDRPLSTVELLERLYPASWVTCPSDVTVRVQITFMLGQATHYSKSLAGFRTVGANRRHIWQIPALEHHNDNLTALPAA